MSNKAEYFMLHLEGELLSLGHSKCVSMARSTPMCAHILMFDENIGLIGVIRQKY